MGFEFRVDSMILRWRSALTGATHIFIRSSWDNYALTIAKDTVTRNASGVLRLALTTPVTSDTAITIRIYAYGAMAGQSFGFGERPINTTNPDIEVRGRMTASVPSGTIQNGIGATSICQGNSVWIKHTFTDGTPPYTVYMRDGSGQLYQNTFQHQIDSMQINPELTWTYTIDSIKDVNGNKSINNLGGAAFQVLQNSALTGDGLFTATQILSDGAYRTFGNPAQCKSWVRIKDSLDGVTLGTIVTTLENTASNLFSSTSRFFVPRKVNINTAQAGHAQITLYYTQDDFNSFNTQIAYQRKMPLDSNDNENNKLNIRVARSAGGTETPTLILLVLLSITWNSFKQHWEVVVDMCDSLLNGSYYLTSPFNSSKMAGVISHTAVIPTAGATNASVTIDWADVPSVTQYRFRFRAQGTLHWNVSTITGSQRTYNYLSFNTTYEVQVRVYEGPTQQGEYTQTYTFTTPTAPGKLPSCVMPSVTSTIIDATSVQLNWPPLLYVQSFQVQVRAKNTLAWGGTITANNQMVFNTLIPNTTYEYRIRTQCESGLTEQPFSDYTVIDTFQTPQLYSCNTPINLSTSSVNANSASVLWNDVNYARVYNVQMRIKTVGVWGGTTVADTSHVFTNLLPNTTYEFRVRSSCSGGFTTNSTSEFSNIDEFTTSGLPLTNCPFPNPINASASASSITLTWNSVSNGALYFIQFKPSSSAVWGGGSTANTQYTLNNLNANTSYQYRIRTTCSTGTTLTPMSTFSPIGTISTNALREWPSTQHDGVNPNPTSGDITIIRSNTTPNNYQVYLTDITGRLLNKFNVLLEEGVNHWNYSLSGYPQGIYFMRIVDLEGHVIVFKIQRQ